MSLQGRFVGHLHSLKIFQNYIFRVTTSTANYGNDGVLHEYNTKTK